MTSLAAISLLTLLFGCTYSAPRFPIPSDAPPIATVTPAVATIPSTVITPTVRIVPCPSIGDGYYPYATSLPSLMRPFRFRTTDGSVLYEGNVAFTLATGGIGTGYAVFVTNTGTRPMPLNLRDFAPILLNSSDVQAAILPNGRPDLIQVYPGETGHSPEFGIGVGATPGGIAFSGVRWRAMGSDDMVDVPFTLSTGAPQYPTRSPGC